jgi:feruloyl-CoA synthase
VSEDFKLLTGTWVNTGSLRLKALAALAPLVQDVVVTGHDREEVGFLLFPNLAECVRLCRDLGGEPLSRDIIADVRVRTAIAAGLIALRSEGSGSSTFASRAILMEEPPSVDAGEITDKGYINQSAVLTRRAELVRRLDAVDPDSEIIVAKLC